MTGVDAAVVIVTHTRSVFMCVSVCVCICNLEETIKINHIQRTKEDEREMT